MLDSALTGYIVFILGVALLGVGLLSIPRSFALAVSTLLGGCTIAALGAVAMLRQRYYDVGDMALPSAVLLGVLQFRYGLGSAWSLWRRTLAAVFAALFAWSFVVGAYRQVDAVITLIPALILWFALVRYRPALGWGRWMRRAALGAILVFLGLMYLLERSSVAMTRTGCFIEVRLPFWGGVHLPHPYDYYITDQLHRYLLIVSLLVSLVCTVGCLGLWIVERYRSHGSLAAKVAE